MDTNEKRPLMIPRGWIQAAAIVLIFGFFILGVLTYYTYNDEPPIPNVVKTINGSILFTREDIMAGQQIFLGNGLMEYGSIFGHGAYLGPDFTAEYLHRAALSSVDFYGGANSDTARSRTIQDFKINRYDNATSTLVYTDAQAHAFNECRAYYATFFGEPTTKFGLRPSAIQDPEEIRELTAFFSWSAWAASTARPGHPYSYTNNWPPEPLVDNYATADSIVWSVLSLVALLGEIGLLLAVFGRWNILGWHGREQQSMSFRAPDEVSLTPAQNACAWFFFIMAALFVVQAHHRRMSVVCGQRSGVYGMLSIGLALFCLRYIIPQKYWSDKAAQIGFWSLNLGLAWMVFATLFPLGILQLYHSTSVSYYDARTLNYIGSRANSILEWLRLPGDVVFILGGTLPIFYLAFLGVRHVRRGTTAEEPKDILFTDIVVADQER